MVQLSRMESPTKHAASVHSHSKDRRAILIIILVVAVLVLVSLLFGKKTTQASTTPDGAMHGYAWSSNTGWLSFNCMEGSATGGSVCATSPYKVTATRQTLPSGHPEVVFSGDAWSPSIGWVSFNATESNVAALCGPAATMDLTTNTASGWIRALNGTTAGGWDGCVQLTGATFNPSTLTLNGFAWGSINIGWMQFVGTIELLPIGSATVDLKITPASGGTPSDGPIMLPLLSHPTLSWTTTGVASCTTTGSTTTEWNSTSLPTDGTQVVTINGPQTYSIQCTPTDGSAPVTDSVTVTTTPTGSTPAVTLNATPISVSAGIVTPVTLSWSTQYMASTTACTGTSSPSVSAWNTTHSASTGAAPTTLPTQTIPLTLTTTPEVFTLHCTPAGGGTALTSSVTININYPACIVTTTSTGITPPSGTAPFQVTWANVASYPVTTLTAGPVMPGAPGVSATLSPTSLSSASASATMTASGLSGSTPTQTVQVGASGIVSGTMVTCTPATISLGAPSTTSTSTPKTHLPWYDF